ncbi:uncharacterized protein LOC106650490 [Trichogramma pretiosum]|uniref:uncharacterized protein LOC106650490 n=1 Tax=Trichogramma pretiosum TaxID=7493 RepID=UPI0006C9D2A2|nr:uncharacterized protein LOC106650490 [Trichogramma pretiosum]
MESRKSGIRVKKEPKDAWSDADHNNIFDSENSNEAKNFETMPFNKLPEKLGDNITVDFECKYVKPELSTNICKTEYQNFQPILKMEKQILTDYLNDKNQIILIKKGFDYENNCQLEKKSQLNLEKSEEMRYL